MIGAICGDIIGSVYEFGNIKTTDFPLFSAKSRFTDDSVMTVATMDTLLNNTSYVDNYKKWFHNYPHAGYGGMFKKWCASNDTNSYHSFGNGSAMRVSPVGLWCKSLEETLEEAKRSAEVTHSHPEGVKGAQATAAAIFLARHSTSKEEIKSFIEENFQYDLDESLDSIRQWYSFDVSCQGTVPQAIRSFIESNSYEDAVRKSISLGGDSDTIACITGGIAEAYYGVPESIIKEASILLPTVFKKLINTFYVKCGVELNGLQ